MSGFDMDAFRREWERDRRDVLGPLRQKVGMPTSWEGYEALSEETVWEYIKELENTLIAERRVMRLTSDVLRARTTL